jgi:L-fuconate dehydratase
VATLLKEAIADGLNHFKVSSRPLRRLETDMPQIKVGASVEGDRRRLAMVRSIIDDPSLTAHRSAPSPGSIAGKNAGPTGNVLMIDANQVWDVQQAIEHVSELAEYRPWFIEVRARSHITRGPDASHLAGANCARRRPRRIRPARLADGDSRRAGHAKIRAALRPLGIGVATGEHAHNR